MDSIDLVHDTILELRLCLYSFVGGTVCGLLSFRMLFVVIAFALGTAVFSAAGYISGRSARKQAIKVQMAAEKLNVAFLVIRQ